jgi:hypothetical protein
MRTVRKRLATLSKGVTHVDGIPNQSSPTTQRLPMSHASGTSSKLKDKTVSYGDNPMYTVVAGSYWWRTGGAN